MPNVAVVMSGGGAKGAFEVGALEHLICDKDIDFKVIAGISTGSLNALMLAQGRGSNELKRQFAALRDIWLGIENYKAIYRERFLAKLLWLLCKDSWYSPDPLWEMIQDPQNVSLDRLKQSGRELRIGAVGLESTFYYEIDQYNDSIREWTLASSSMPLLFPPVAVDGQYAMDGGIRNVTPLRAAFKALSRISADGEDSPDEMYVLFASPFGIKQAEPPWKSGRAILERAIEIMVNEIYCEDVLHAILVNRSVRAYRQLESELQSGDAASKVQELLGAFHYRYPDYRDVKIYGVVPDKEYCGGLEFEPAKIQAAYDAGKAAAKNPLNEDQLHDLLKDLRQPPKSRAVAGISGSEIAQGALPERPSCWRRYGWLIVIGIAVLVIVIGVVLLAVLL
ncbi:MAG: hypothetical protein GTN62_15340 [Gemmatimonadales bacterium]|nr:hypothetical protein [Gemmatimonadales bacterium]NIN13186.1 hypothetical protein [Gemmatimonadales bacterium]NIN51464.1 hypothetical protein [Gemmatimonadales bacterium]NIP08928.1 hypothetical protein [Gemmatimonadales bacterium]NIR03716.1 hypothetical protein [Gemmatimonadales bacterium]